MSKKKEKKPAHRIVIGAVVTVWLEREFNIGSLEEAVTFSKQLKESDFLMSTHNDTGWNESAIKIVQVYDANFEI